MRKEQKRFKAVSEWTRDGRFTIQFEGEEPVIYQAPFEVYRSMVIDSSPENYFRKNIERYYKRVTTEEQNVNKS